MDPIFSKKGQTALEYLLIVVVAIIVVVAVMVWMNSTTTTTTTTAGEAVSGVVCYGFTTQAQCNAQTTTCNWTDCRPGGIIGSDECCPL
jgi:uncharacterized protein (UPF0333 family)